MWWYLILSICLIVEYAYKEEVAGQETKKKHFVKATALLTYVLTNLLATYQ